MSVEPPQEERQRKEHLPRRSRLSRLFPRPRWSSPPSPPAWIIQGFWCRSTVAALRKLHHLILGQKSHTHDREAAGRCSCGFVSSKPPSDGLLRCSDTNTHGGPQASVPERKTFVSLRGKPLIDFSLRPVSSVWS